MGRALFAVGALLATGFLVFGLVVFLTREEDTVSVDNVLAEEITRAIQLAEDQEQDVDLRRLARFEWDRVLVVAPGTSREAVSKALGSEYQGELPVSATSPFFVFARGDRLVRYADYRGRGRRCGCATSWSRRVSGGGIGPRQSASRPRWGGTLCGMVKTTVYLPEGDAAALRRLASRSGRSQADIIRDAIAAAIARDLPPRRFHSAGVGSGSGDAVARHADELVRQAWARRRR
jgi:predicted transcriptional regulator